MAASWILLALVALLVMGAWLARPLRWLGLAAARTVVGALWIVGLNVVLPLLGWRLPVNPVAAAMVGFLGIPGLLALLIGVHLLGG